MKPSLAIDAVYNGPEQIVTMSTLEGTTIILLGTREKAEEMVRAVNEHKQLIDALERTVQVLEIAAVFVRDDCGRKETAQGFFSNAKVARAVLDRAHKGEGSCQSQQP